MQYAKAIITTCLSLYSTRLILDALAVDDYGIYTLVGGVVAMLGFITNALIITTQRYLSFYSKQESTTYLRRLFANSFFIHVMFGIGISVVLLALTGVLFDKVLNISADRTAVAVQVYYVTVAMLLLTILTSPFKAAFIAHENILFVTVVEIADAVVKLLLALMLCYVSFDKLLVYAWMMLTIVLLNFLAFCIYGMLKFPECRIPLRRSVLDGEIIGKITGFAGWTTYGMGCVAARNQGTAVVLNHFFGTAINAAYGIAFQVNGAISFLVTSILNAMNPQLMQAEGKGDRETMLKMAARQSKFSVAILAIVIIPLMVEMPSVLGLWLKEVPAHTSMFCRFILLAFLCDQITLGLSSANQAIGHIRTFTLLTYTPKLLYIFVIWFMLQQGQSVTSVMTVYVVIELGVALLRIPYMKHKAGLPVVYYVSYVILPTVVQSVLIGIACWLCASCLSVSYRLFFTLAVAATTGALAGWYVVLTPDERQYTAEMVKKQLSL